MILFDDYAPTLKYIGCVKDFNCKSNRGDVALIDDNYYMFTGNEWIEYAKAPTYEKVEPKKILPRLCSQCGAPVKSYRSSCEYCGVNY